MSEHPSRIPSLVGGTILIGLGVLFLLGQFFNFSGLAFLWPLVIVAAGAVFFVGMVLGGRPAAPLAIPGSILSTIGLLMLFQSLTDYWTSWAYAWGLLIAAVGVGIFVMGLWTGDERQRESGLRLAGVGVVLFLIFGAFFELFIFNTRQPGLARLFFPSLMILTGIYLLVRRVGLWPARRPSPPEPPQAPQA